MINERYVNAKLCELQNWLAELTKTVQSGTALKQTYIAGQTISGGKAVMIDTDKKVYAFDITNPYHYDKYLGIAETAALSNQPITIVTHGINTVIGQGWIQGASYFIGLDSYLTIMPPTIGYLKQVAVGVNSNTILINSQLGMIKIS